MSIFNNIRQAEWPWEKRQVGNFVAKNALDIFHVQTSEAKNPPNLVFRGLERN
jgi:hypothetical protein